MTALRIWDRTRSVGQHWALGARRWAHGDRGLETGDPGTRGPGDPPGMIAGKDDKQRVRGDNTRNFYSLCMHTTLVLLEY